MWIAGHTSFHVNCSQRYNQCEARGVVCRATLGRPSVRLVEDARIEC